MKILITGANGQLGRALALLLPPDNKLLCPSKLDFDITNKSAVNEVMNDFAPDVIFHCAAYTAVDKAEGDETTCMAVNCEGTRNIATCASKLEAKMVYISTDYVFDGLKEGVYEIDSATCPLSVYGKSKLAGESLVRQLVPKHFIVRTSWVFGDGNNFVRTMLRIGKTSDDVKVVCDQIGSPTYTADLAKFLVKMADTDAHGTYHATNEGFCSWAEFAEEIFKLARYSTVVKHITTSEFKSVAPRPLNARLSKECLTNAGFDKLPPWQAALKQYIDNGLR